jgi:hypothetical protein
LGRIKDIFSQNEEVNMEDLLTKLFFIDSRLFKHYRLLAWFPKYFKMYYESQCLLMDNGQGGN